MDLLNILLIFIFCAILFYNKEHFHLGIGKGFGLYIPPNECLPENNCHKGSYFRTQSYQNVCPPDYGGLNRTKVQLQDGCLRNLGTYPEPKYKFNCYVDDRLHRHCSWYRT